MSFNLVDIEIRKIEDSFFRLIELSIVKIELSILNLSLIARQLLYQA